MFDFNFISASMQIYFNRTSHATIHYCLLLCRGLWIQATLEHTMKRTVFMVNTLDTNVAKCYRHNYRLHFILSIKKVEHTFLSSCAFYKVTTVRHNSPLRFPMHQIAWRTPCYFQQIISWVRRGASLQKALVSFLGLFGP